MTYPPSTLPVNAIDGPSATDVSDPAWVLTAAEVNATNVAINDIVTELGTDPSGAEATVTARLSALGSVWTGSSAVWKSRPRSSRSSSLMSRSRSSPRLMALRRYWGSSAVVRPP